MTCDVIFAKTTIVTRGVIAGTFGEMNVVSGPITATCGMIPTTSGKTAGNVMPTGTSAIGIAGKRFGPVNSLI